MNLRARPLAFRFGVALLITAFAIMLRVALRPVLGPSAFTFITFFPAVISSAWWLGLAPGIMSTVMATLFSMLILPPGDSLAVHRVSHLAAVGIFTTTGIALSGLATRFHRTVDHLQQTRDSRRQLAAIVESSDEAMIGLSLDGRVMSWNPGAERLFGWSAEEMVGTPITTIVPSDRIEEDREILRRVGEGEHIRHLETTRLTKEGRAAHVSLTVSPMRNARGRIAGVSNVARDITDRKASEEALRRSEKLYRSIGESIDYGVWVCDPNGRNIYVSDSFLRLVGLTQEECSEFGWQRILHPADADATIAAWKKCVEAGTFWEREHRFRGVDGEWHHVLARGLPVRDEQDRIVYWAGINLDISAMKEAQRALELADRRKDEFIAMLSHEIRNPLAAIGTAAAILGLSDDPLAVSSAADVIRRQVAQLSSMMEDLLDVSRITTGKISLGVVPLRLDRLVADTLEAIRQRDLDARHQISVGCAAVWVSGDESRLVQIVENLVGNALKYTPPGGEVEVSVRREGMDAVLEVRDTGVGMRPESLQHIFEPFVQEEVTMDRSKGGLGLGLSLVKRLTHLHEGTVSAYSEGPGLGTCFTVRLPAVPGPRGKETAGSREAPCDRKRILIVEDNQDAREVLRMLLEISGHEVYEAIDGIAGLRSALDLRPDVALVDLGLPELDGFEVARRIRAAEDGGQIRLIAVSGYGQAEDRQRSREAGFDAHLVKPVDAGQLTALLQAATLGGT